MKNISKILFLISIVFIILFIVFISIDYSQYNESFSAPFSVSILLRSIEFILPSIILFIIGFVLKKRVKNENNK